MGTVSTEQDGRVYTVPDTDKPVWFGKYQNGKLAVYEAVVTGDVIPNTVTYISSYLDESSGKDFCGFSIFDVGTPVQAALNCIFETVFDAHQSAHALTVPPNKTLH